jgi:UDP-N-acetylglucosamine acyltransferase
MKYKGILGLRSYLVSDIHPTAIISPEATIGEDVSIGPYCVIGPQVTLENNVKLGPHVVITGHTKIGSHTAIYSFSCLGDPPQDLKYKQEDSQLIIGNHNYIGHYVTMNGGTKHGDLITRIGDHCMFMDDTHVAHDCKIGHHVTLTNATVLAGHVHVDDYALLGGQSAVLQHVHIGRGAMVAGKTGVRKNVIPYGYAEGYQATLDSMNVIGLKRLGIKTKDIHAVISFYKNVLCKKNDMTFEERLAQFKANNELNPTLLEIITFIEKDSKKSIAMPKE